MPLVGPRYTIADLDRLADDGNRYEVLAGTMLVTPGAGGLHQAILSRLFLRVASYLEPAALAFAVSPGVIQSGRDTQLEPDLLIIPIRYFGLRWRKAAGQWLAVEVSGRDSRLYDRDYKRDAYLALGVREVWRLDLRDRAVFVSRLGAPPERPHRERLEWHPADMSDALVLDVQALFQGYRPTSWS